MNITEEQTSAMFTVAKARTLDVLMETMKTRYEELEDMDRTAIVFAEMKMIAAIIVSAADTIAESIATIMGAQMAETIKEMLKTPRSQEMNSSDDEEATN